MVNVRYLFLVLLLKGIILLTSANPYPVKWKKECPHECQCPITSLSKSTLMSRWFTNQEVKLSLCTVQKETKLLQMFQNVPTDTEILTVLQNTDVSYNTLLPEMISHLQSLQGIDLQGEGNKKKLKLSSQVFHVLPHLKFLSLQQINLGNVEKLFSNLQVLEIIQIINCNIGIVKWEMLEGLKSLKELHFIHSGIKELGDFSFYGAPELRRLFLSHNDLFSVQSNAFIGLRKLEVLDLSNNQLDHLSSLTFPSLPKLQWLELKHNPIKVIFPHCFQLLNSTQRLTLGHSQQPTHLMKFSFRGLQSLIFLHIPNVDNDILLEHMFYGLNSLLHLNLNGRIMVLGDKAFMGAHKALKKLVLHNCKLRKISNNSFQGLYHLLSLDLSYNQLRYISEYSLQPLKSLKELILSQNKLTILSEEIFQIVSLQALRLDANPWNCTCSMLVWKGNLTAKVSYTISKACNSAKNSSCSDFETIYKDDKRIIPRCEYPNKFQGRNVFEAIKILKCNETIHSS
ncbi:insulin-like growth factor-binding protein complex acid labile subunit [Centruroides vittatus]|uniref:insulin-like growth factor-binding protein complex acid labile subunit n=1 Tax=Centruroides vittatus TaxID=120091 RepID=UPI00350FFE49